MRLVNGQTSCDGIVEGCLNKQWISVCYNGSVDANTWTRRICKMANYEEGR